jgi:hypothetical protein
MTRTGLILVNLITQECMSNQFKSCRMNVNNNHVVSSFLSSSELPLPLFDEAKNNNPVSHIRQLDEFMKFRGVPKALQQSPTDQW